MTYKTQSSLCMGTGLIPQAHLPSFAQTQPVGPGVCSVTRLCLALWSVARLAPRSVGFPRQEYSSRLPCPSPKDLRDPGIKPMSPAVTVGHYIAPPGNPLSSVVCTLFPQSGTLSHYHHTKIFSQQNLLRFPHPLLVGSASCLFHIEFTTSSSQTLYHSVMQPHSTFLPFFTDTSTSSRLTQRLCLLLEPRKVSGTQDLVEKYAERTGKKKKKNLSEEVFKWFNLSAKVLYSTKTSLNTLKALRTNFTNYVSTLLL